MKCRSTFGWRGGAICVAGLALGITAVSHAVPVQPRGSSSQSLPSHGQGSLASLPVLFERNEGQTDDRVDYLARGSGYTLFLRGTESVLRLTAADTPAKSAARSHPPAREAVIRTRLLGANRHAQAEATAPSRARMSYYLGNDPKRWRTGVRSFGRVTYRGVYRGIDVAYYGKSGAYEYDFTVAAGADPKQIRLGMEGTKKLRLEADGRLVLPSPVGDITELRPIAYQEKEGNRAPVEVSYRLLSDHSVGLQLGAYDRSQPLVIDPEVVGFTIGGTGIETLGGFGFAGNEFFMAGTTSSVDFPVAGTLSGGTRASLSGSSDGFVAVVSASAQSAQLVAAAYIGGSGADSVNALTGNVGSANLATLIIAGQTSSPDLPLGGGTPYRSALSGPSDAFVQTLSFQANQDGTFLSLQSGTYLGGSGDDVANAVLLHGGVIWVAGSTHSSNFPTPSGSLSGGSSTLSGSSDGFLAEFNIGCSSLIGAAYLGGTGDDRIDCLSLDGSGNILFSGAASAGLTRAGTYHGGNSDALWGGINGAGAIIYSYAGGSGDDEAYSITNDGLQTYIAGGTSSTDLPIVNGFQTQNIGPSTAFLMQFDKGSLIYSTYAGNSGSDTAYSVAVLPNRGDNVVIGGASVGGGFVTRIDTSATGQSSFVGTEMVGGANSYVKWLFGSFDDSFDLAGSGGGIGNQVGPGGGGDAFAALWNINPSIAAPVNLSAGTYPNPSAVTITYPNNEYGTFYRYASEGSYGYQVIQPAITSGPYGSGVNYATDTTVSPGVTYSYFLRAGAPGACSTPMTLLVHYTTPDVPSGLTAIALDSTHVQLSWTNGTAQQTGVTINRNDGASFQTSGSSYVDNTAAPATYYTYTVTAYNGTGAGSSTAGPSKSASVTTPPLPPAAPTNLTAAPGGGPQATVSLSWSEAGTATGYKIERALGNGAFSQINSSLATSTSYTDSDPALTGNTTYTYQVRAANLANNLESDSGYSNTATVTTLVTPPANFSAVGGSSTSINLTWTNTNSSQIGTKVERSTDGGTTYSQITVTSATATGYTDTGLSSGTQYTYRVRATTSSGDSSYAGPLSTATLVNPPTLAVTTPALPQGLTQLNLSWTLPTGNVTSFSVYRSQAGGGYSFVNSVPANTTSFSDTSLTADTTYTYYVAAINAGGGSNSNTVSGTTLPNAPALTITVPAAPTGITQLNLSWTESGAVSGYTLQRSVDGSNYTTIATPSATTTTFPDMGLTGGTTYYYQLKATNAGGDSSYAYRSATTLPAIPTAPTQLAVTAPAPPSGITWLTLTWTRNSTNETGFKIERAPDGMTFTQIAVAAAGATSYTDTGLTANSTYTYRVRATNSSGDSVYSNTAAGTTLPNPPAAPSNLTATTPAAPAGATQIVLNWTRNSTNETGFKIWRAPSGYSYAQVAIAAAGATTYTDTGLSASTTYNYVVTATNTGGDSGYSNPVNATTLPSPPAPPATLGVNASSTSQLNLSWSYVNGASNGYKVQRSTDGTNYTQIAANFPNTSYSDYSLPANTQYWYRVLASNAGGDSSPSTAASGTTISLAPSGLAATQISTTENDLTWSQPSSGPVNSYTVYRSTGGTFSQVFQGNALAYADKSVSAGQICDYYVVANNAGGTSAASATVQVNTFSFVPPSLTGYAKSKTSIQLNWNYPAGATSGNSKFEMRWTYDDQTFYPYSGGYLTTTSYLDPTLWAGAYEGYQIRTVDIGSGAPTSAWSNLGDLMTMVPYDPTAGSVTVVTNNGVRSISITWTDNSWGEQNFQIRRAPANNPTNWTRLSNDAPLNMNQNQSQTSDTPSAGSYFYQVRAVNPIGNSNWVAVNSTAITF